MKQTRLFNFISMLSTAAFTAVLVFLLLIFGIPVPEAAQTEIDTGSGSVTAISITDLAECNIISSINYTPDVFLKPKYEIRGENKEINPIAEVAERGTYEFVILNIDPEDEHYQEKAAALDKMFLEGDNCWHVTLYIPACFSACNIYVDTILTARIGEIADYDFTDYTESNYTGVTEYHQSSTEPTFVDLSFYTRRAAMSTTFDTRATIVTVHYETSGGLGGILQQPLIGTNAAVHSAVNSDATLSIIISVIAALLCASLTFACILKRSLSFLPFVFINLGLMMYFFANGFLLTATMTPYLWMGVRGAALHWSASAAVCSLRVKIKKFPVWIVPAALGGINCVLTFLLPYVWTYLALRFFLFYSVIVFAIAAYMLIVYSAYFSASFQPVELVSAVLSVSTVLVGLNVFSSVLIAADPVIWLCFVLLVFITGYAVAHFVSLEQRNDYLTNNLQAEIARQTQGLREVVNNHETLLRYLTHDMRKPVLSMKNFLAELEINERDEEQIKTIHIIQQKANLVDGSINELQQYSKRQFFEEESKIFDAGALVTEVCETLRPDCEANNILLKKGVASVKIYAKYKTLRSVLNNLIFNALEHSGCSQITVTAYKTKSGRFLSVTDNGNGFAPDFDAFSPYSSKEQGENNLGLGLYLCQQATRQMGGTLTMESHAGKTIFVIAFPSSPRKTT